jgi:hypothetical protein
MPSAMLLWPHGHFGDPTLLLFVQLPRPGWVYKPLIPSDSKRFTQPLTLCAVISVCSPTCAELKPSDLSSVARQRIREQWLSPVRKPKVNSTRSDSVSINVSIFIRILFFYEAKIR